MRRKGPPIPSEEKGETSYPVGRTVTLSGGNQEVDDSTFPSSRTGGKEDLTLPRPAKKTTSAGVERKTASRFLEGGKSGKWCQLGTSMASPQKDGSLFLHHTRKNAPVTKDRREGLKEKIYHEGLRKHGRGVWPIRRTKEKWLSFWSRERKVFPRPWGREPTCTSHSGGINSYCKSLALGGALCGGRGGDAVELEKKRENLGDGTSSNECG